MAQNDTIVSDLIFNSMSQAEFNAQMQAETLDPNQFYLTPDTTQSQLNDKADITTVDAIRSRVIALEGYDYVVAEQKPNASNNYTWYRKYKSGWVEQGGRYVNLSLTGAQGTLTATLPIPVTGSNIMASPEYVSGDSVVVVTSWCSGTVANTTVEKNSVSSTLSTTASARWIVFGIAQ